MNITENVLQGQRGQDSSTFVLQRLYNFSVAFTVSGANGVTRDVMATSSQQLRSTQHSMGHSSNASLGPGYTQ